MKKIQFLSLTNKLVNMRANLLFNHEIESVFIKVKYQRKQRTIFRGAKNEHSHRSLLLIVYISRVLSQFLYN